MKLRSLFVFLTNFFKYRFLYYKTKYFDDFCFVTKNSILSKDIDLGSQIIIYGFGPYGKEWFINLFNYAEIKEIYDKNKYQFDRKIRNPEYLNFQNCDYIIVTVMDELARKSILSFLQTKGISIEKIIFVIDENQFS